MQTQMFLFRAVRPASQNRIDAFIEATDETRAWEAYEDQFGAYDPDPDFPDFKDVEIVEVPPMKGQTTVNVGYEFN